MLVAMKPGQIRAHPDVVLGHLRAQRLASIAKLSAAALVATYAGSSDSG